MPSPHSLGYIQINDHKYKERHPLTITVLNFFRNVLGGLILLFAILMPFFTFWLISMPQA